MAHIFKIQSLLLMVSNPPSEQQWQKTFISSPVLAPQLLSFFSHSSLCTSLRNADSLFHCLSRGEGENSSYQFHLLIHFMTKLETPITKPDCTLTYLTVLTSSSLLGHFTHTFCIASPFWPVDSLIMGPRYNCARVSWAYFYFLPAYLHINPKMPVSTRQ